MSIMDLMRHKWIVKCRLKGGYDVHVIVEGSCRADCVKKVCNNSKGMGKEFEVTPRECSIDSWRCKQKNFVAGGRPFDYCIIDREGRIHNGTINGFGIKTAHNNLMLGKDPKYQFLYLMDSNQRQKMRQRGEKSTLKAKNVLQSKGQTVALFSKAMEKSETIQGVPVLKEVSLMFNMVVDYMQGNYKEVPFGTIIGVTAAVIYFVSPVDFIPDFIPGLGQMDDVGAIMLAIKYAKKDLTAYEIWKNSQKTDKQDKNTKKAV